MDEIEQRLPFDSEWHTLSIIWLRPSARLSVAQAAVVRRAYGFSDDLLKVEVRMALEFYRDQRWGLNETGARLEGVCTEYLPIETGWPEYSRPGILFGCGALLREIFPNGNAGSSSHGAA